MTNNNVFACFAVVRVGDQIWATTRDGKDTGKIGLPGGKCDSGETPVETAIRESSEEGLLVHGDGKLIHQDLVDGKLVQWFEFDSATKLDTYKEKYRGINPILVPIFDIAMSGFGNDFLIEG